MAASASFLLQAQGSNAQAVALANAGGDTVTAIKQAAEFNIGKEQRLVALIFDLQSATSLGLKAAQGLTAMNAFYWDMNDTTRAWSKRYQEREPKQGMPNHMQAGVYSGIMHYLKAVEKVGSAADGRAVVAAMKSMPIDDPPFEQLTKRSRGSRLQRVGKAHDCFRALRILQCWCLAWRQAAHDPIPAVPLGSVQRLIGRLHECRKRRNRLTDARHANADRHAVLYDRTSAFSDLMPKAIGLGLSRAKIRFRKQKRKFIAADPTQNVQTPFAGTREVCHVKNDCIARFMTKTVIDQLEVIDINHQERKRPSVAPGTLPFPLCECHEMAAVENAGHSVDARQSFHFLRVPDNIGDIAVSQHAAAAGEDGELTSQNRAICHR